MMMMMVMTTTTTTATAATTTTTTSAGGAAGPAAAAAPGAGGGSVGVLVGLAKPLGGHGPRGQPARLREPHCGGSSAEVGRMGAGPLAHTADVAGRGSGVSAGADAAHLPGSGSGAGRHDRGAARRGVWRTSGEPSGSEVEVALTKDACVRHAWLGVAVWFALPPAPTVLEVLTVPKDLQRGHPPLAPRSPTLAVKLTLVLVGRGWWP